MNIPQQRRSCWTNRLPLIHLVPRYGADDGIHMGFDEHEPDFAALADLADSIAKEATE